MGEHSGGIILQKAQAGEATGQTGATIVTRVGIRVYETVPGEIIKDLDLVDFTVNLSTIKPDQPVYDIILIAQNKSNVTLKPQVDLTISGWGKIWYEDIADISFKKIKQFVTGQDSFPIWL